MASRKKSTPALKRRVKPTSNVRKTRSCGHSRSLILNMPYAAAILALQADLNAAPLALGEPRGQHGAFLHHRRR